MIFGSRVGSILSTCPYQMSFFRVMSSNIVSCASIFSLIYAFVFLSSLEILVDRLNSSLVCVQNVGIFLSEILSSAKQPKGKVVPVYVMKVYKGVAE